MCLLHHMCLYCCLQVLPELMPALKGVVTTCDIQLTTRCLTTLLSLHTGASGTVGVVKVASCEVSDKGEGCSTLRDYV